MQTRIFYIIALCSLCYGQVGNPLIIDNDTMMDSLYSKSIVFPMPKRQYMTYPETLSDESKEKIESELQSAVLKKNSNSQNLLEILGKDVERVDKFVIVRGSGVLKNKDSYILADEIVYNTELRQARLRGNVKIYRDNTLALYTQNAMIYLSINFSIIQPFYIQDTRTGIWANASSSSKQNDIYKFTNSIVSGCSYNTPAWRISSNSGTYDSKGNTLSLWGTKIYIGDIPVFYMPYIKFSLTQDRTSGFLYPTFGSSSTDGFTYIQPYYIAPQNFWDITISPQVRTNRGFGANFEFRAVDSYNDKYLLHLKYFRNSDEYVKTLNLQNQSVYGFDFKHTKRNVLQEYFGLNSNIDNGMFFDLAFMNDIDYMRLDDVRYYLNATQYVSKINLFAQTNNHYYGINMRYYLNLRMPNDNTILHDLPSIQYHKFLGNLFIDELLYSINYQGKNALRHDGYSYLSNELYVPVGMQFSFMNKYFSLGAWLNLRAGNVITYNKSDTLIFTQPNMPQMLTDAFGNYVNASFKASLNSDIGRQYGNFFHSMQSSLVLNVPIPSATYSNGNLSQQILNTFPRLQQEVIDAAQNGVNIYDPTLFANAFPALRILDLKFSNFIYNKDGREIFYWQLRQSFNFSDSISVLRIPMENKIGTSFIKGLNISASLFYSWFFDSFTELGLNATYRKDSFSASLSYYLKRDDLFWNFDPITMTYRTIDSSNYLSASIRGDLRYVGLVADLSYDFRTRTVVNLGVGIYKDIKCFGFGIKVGSNRTPIITEGSNIGVIDNIYIKAEFKFVPLTTFGYTYRLRPRISNVEN